MYNMKVGEVVNPDGSTVELHISPFAKSIFEGLSKEYRDGKIKANKLVTITRGKDKKVKARRGKS